MAKEVGRNRNVFEGNSGTGGVTWATYQAVPSEPKYNILMHTIWNGLNASNQGFMRTEGSIYKYGFPRLGISSTSYRLEMNFNLPGDYVEGTDIQPFMLWSTASGSVPDSTHAICANYKFIKSINESYSTGCDCKQFAVGSNVFKVNKLEYTKLAGSSFSVYDSIWVQLSIDYTGGARTSLSNLNVWGFGLLYQCDGDGSTNMTTKD